MAAASGKPVRQKPGPAPVPLPPRPVPESSPSPSPADLLRFTSAPPGGYAERRSVLFHIDGTDYTVLDNPLVCQGFEYLDRARADGPLAAALWAMEAMLGPEGYQALRDCQGLPQAGLQRVMQVCTEKLARATDPPKEEEG